MSKELDEIKAQVAERIKEAEDEYIYRRAFNAVKGMGERGGVPWVDTERTLHYYKWTLHKDGMTIIFRDNFVECLEITFKDQVVFRHNSRCLYGNHIEVYIPQDEWKAILDGLDEDLQATSVGEEILATEAEEDEEANELKRDFDL